MLEIMVQENGILIIKNKGDKSINVWRIDFSYFSDTLTNEPNKREKNRIRRMITESITTPFKLNPSDEKSIELRIPRSILKEVSIYYEVNGLYRKEKKVLNSN